MPLDPAGGWTVTLTASTNDLWPTQYTTLTATANADVGPSPYYISIYDGTTGAQVAICAFGATCSVSETEPTASTQDYIAYIGNDTSMFPPSTIVATSSEQSVVWITVTVGMEADPIMPALGEAVDLDSVATPDVGPSPFFIEIWDITTGTLVADCGSGSFCHASVSESTATTQEYIADVADFSTTYPPAAIQATSDIPSFVTWSTETWSAQMIAQTITHGPETYTVTANHNVGPTPYFIEIWDQTTGALLAVCGSGNSCSVVYQPGTAPEFLIGFVASYSSTFPPTNIQANTGFVETFFQPL